MSWWQKLQDLLGHTPTEPKPPRPKGAELFMPSAVQALASGGDDTVFRVEIRGVGVHSIRVHSSRPMRDASYVVRVPVGLNFEKRETTEFVEFTGTPFYVRRTPNGHETFLRYTETVNSRRDRWLNLVLDTYGFAINEAGDIEAQVHDLPCVLLLADGAERAGSVESVSLKGLMARVATDGLAEGQTLGLRVGGPDAPQMKGTVAAIDGDGVGIRFTEVTNEQYRHLIDQVRRLASNEPPV